MAAKSSASLSQKRSVEMAFPSLTTTSDMRMCVTFHLHKLPMNVPHDSSSSKESLAGASMKSYLSSRRAGLHKLQRAFASDNGLIHPLSSEEDLKNRHFPFPSPTIQPQNQEVTEREAPLKKRKFQRRNSKTSAMMLNSLRDIVTSRDPFEENVPTSLQSERSTETALDIAEVLACHLRSRRQKSHQVSSATDA